jgi:hypothetical protein
VDAELAIVDETPAHDGSRSHVDPGPVVQADLDAFDEPPAARQDHPIPRTDPELLQGQILSLDPGATRDAACPRPRARASSRSGRRPGRSRSPIIPEELSRRKLAERADPPQAPIVEKHLVSVDAHLLRVAAHHRAALSRAPWQPLFPRLVCPVMTQYPPSFVAATVLAPLMIVLPLPAPISFCPCLRLSASEIR